MINEAVVRELIQDRETELQMLFRCAERAARDQLPRAMQRHREQLGCF